VVTNADGSVRRGRLDISGYFLTLSGALSELFFSVLQEGHQGNKGLSAFQLLHRNHENGLEEPVEFFLSGLRFSSGRCVVVGNDSGICILFLFQAASSLDFSFRFFVHLALTLGECILIFCDGISP
jgi:hypothetical protein